MTRGRLQLAVAALALGAFAAASCSSAGDETSTTSPSTDVLAPSTTLVETPTEEAQLQGAAFVDRGPYRVGSTALTLDDGRRAAVWYPAEPGAEEFVEDFDLASLLSPELQANIDEASRPQHPIQARTDAAPSGDGPFPVVLFSHGFSGFPEQSADLVTHLASWGMVVVAPDHVERSIGGMLGTAAQGIAERDDPSVLSAALDAAIAAAQSNGSILSGLVDPQRVAVGGHSAGAAAAYRMASLDDRIDAFIAYSVRAETVTQPSDGSAPAAVPTVPGMVMLGTSDETIPAESSRELFELMNTPKALVEIEGAGHLVFADICLIGRDQGGLVGLVAKIGLDLPENLLRLASDGCQPEALNPELAFGGVDHLSVSFLRWVFGEDQEPVGFDQAALDEIGTAPITITTEFGS